ncbi:uncharacterized protein A1O9_06412 [Exophiala aquamarina CBS 119918]|uniref:MAGE domain-containing protein n=1 Tax=Exophiala aquamarina CBS 119918 TaxID=1182545 RepID=A0A072PF31_9EURO|nr:uncharacterized protein A1O9_06412 [Exophiala aquamarina CBS 119918]KEF58486.1 hypothetical protein A1O9_06412 [Exophiala aquamarina CBS 119918]
MARLKRRADAISRDPSESDPESDEPQPHRRRRSTSESSNQSNPSSVASDHDEPTGQNQEQTLVKKLVRLALATEYSRTPLRRSDISTKLFKDSYLPSRNFRTVFDGAQKILKDTFGMELFELPSREKINLKDRRLQATQTKTSNSSTKSWILVSTLPPGYKTNPAIIQPTKAPDVGTEAGYTALYTLVISLIYLNNNSLAEQKLSRYLRRLNADTNTPFGMLDKVLQRMQKEGYIDKRRDTVMGEEVTEWFVGPRGKVEVGIRGVTGLVKSVYGHGAVSLFKRQLDDDEEANNLAKVEGEELNAKLSRSLGVKITSDTRAAQQEDGASEDELADVSGSADPEEAGPSRRRQQKQPARGGKRRQAVQDDNDDDDDD